MMSNEELLNIAKEARKNSFAPISNYHVGSALLTKSGKVYKGCNIEDPSGIGVTNCCAERTAFIKAISEGELNFERIAVVGGAKDNLELCTPCGVCRQYMMNFNPELTIIAEDNNKVVEFKLNELLPNAWYTDVSKIKKED